MKTFILVLSFLLVMAAASVSFAKAPKIEPAVGFGSQYLNMVLESPSEKVEYSTTNQSFWFVNLSVFDLSAQLKFPVRSSEDEIKSRGNTKIVDYQLSADLTPQWQVEVYHQDYEGYYLTSRSASVIQPDLKFSHSGGQVIYVFNPDYAASMVRTTSWKQTASAGSWMTSWGFDYFDLGGNLNPSSQSAVRGAAAHVASMRVSYGYNWIKGNWFGGMAAGLGGSFTHSEYRRSADYMREDRLDVISNAGLSGGYQWKQTKVGLFSRLNSWKLVFGNEELSSNTSSTGLYFSAIF